MKKLIFAIAVSMLVAGCASSGPSHVVGPTALGSTYRTLHEVIVIETYKREGRKWERDRNSIVTVVEDTKTGERYEIFGNFGRPNEKFKIGL